MITTDSVIYYVCELNLFCYCFTYYFPVYFMFLKFVFFFYYFSYIFVSLIRFATQEQMRKHEFLWSRSYWNWRDENFFVNTQQKYRKNKLKCWSREKWNVRNEFKRDKKFSHIIFVVRSGEESDFGRVVCWLWENNSYQMI